MAYLIIIGVVRESVTLVDARSRIPVRLSAGNGPCSQLVTTQNDSLLLVINPMRHIDVTNRSSPVPEQEVEKEGNFCLFWRPRPCRPLQLSNPSNTPGGAMNWVLRRSRYECDPRPFSAIEPVHERGDFLTHPLWRAFCPQELKSEDSIDFPGRTEDTQL